MSLRHNKQRPLWSQNNNNHNRTKTRPHKIQQRGKVIKSKHNISARSLHVSTTSHNIPDSLFLTHKTLEREPLLRKRLNNNNNNSNPIFISNTQQTGTVMNLTELNINNPIHHNPTGTTIINENNNNNTTRLIKPLPTQQPLHHRKQHIKLQYGNNNNILQLHNNSTMSIIPEIIPSTTSQTENNHTTLTAHLKQFHNITAATTQTSIKSTSQHNRAFRQTSPQRDIPRLLIVGLTGLAGAGYHFYKKKNQEYFEMMERLEKELDEKRAAGKTTADLSQAARDLARARNRVMFGLDKHNDRNNSGGEGYNGYYSDQEVDPNDDPLRPRLAEEFAEEDMRGNDDIEERIDELDQRHFDAGADDMVEKGYIDKQSYELEQQREYLNAILQRYDRVVSPLLRWPKQLSLDKSMQVLGIERIDISKEAVDDRFRALMALNHPDKGGSPYLAMRITEARLILWQAAKSDPDYRWRVEKKEQQRRDRDEQLWLKQIRRRLNVLQRRREIMEFRKSMWGTPMMNRELMVVENEASRKIHNLDYGILQMNRGQWPTITFAGWKPQIFRTEEENERWEEFQIIRQELKTAQLRREIDQYHELQNRDWEIIKYEYKQRMTQENQGTMRPMADPTYNERTKWELAQEKYDFTPEYREVDDNYRINALREKKLANWGETRRGARPQPDKVRKKMKYSAKRYKWNQPLSRKHAYKKGNSYKKAAGRWIESMNHGHGFGPYAK